MKRRSIGIALMVILSASMAVGSMILALNGYETYVEFANPFSYVPASPSSSIGGMGMTAISNYTVVFVLDGVRADTFFETQKPDIESIGGWANFTDTTVSTLISVSRVGYAVISSGVNSSESEVISNDYDEEFHGDTIWNTTVRNGGTTGFVGSQSWFGMFGEWINYTITFGGGQLINVTNPGTRLETPLAEHNDSTVAQYAQALFDARRPDFMLVHFSDTDHWGENEGPSSQEYVDALEKEDEYIGEILASYEAAGLLNQTTVIITADHGMVSVGPNRGNHGGIEPEALHIPLLIRGPGVNPGVYSSPVHQNSIAPTISALMGYEIPTDCSGSVLFSCLDLTAREEAIYRINQAQIRHSQAQSRLRVMQLDNRFNEFQELAVQNINYAVANFTGNDFNEAISSAILSESYSLEILRASKSLKITDEIMGRSLVIGGPIAIILIILGLSLYRKQDEIDSLGFNKRLLGISILSTLAYFIALAFSIVLTGWRFSASYVPEAALDFMIPVFTITLIAFVPAVIFFFIINAYAQKDYEDNRVSGTLWIASFFALVSLSYVMLLLYFIIRNGTGLPWYAPDLVEGTQYFFASISTMAFALFSLVIFLGGLGVSKLHHIWKMRARQ